MTKRAERRLAPLALVLGAISFSETAAAIDTLENYAPGLSDAEAYVGTDGLGGPPHGVTLAHSAGIGGGLTPRLSLFIGYEVTTNRQLAEAARGLSTTLYGTLLQRTHLSLDLGATLHTGDSAASFAPFFEANWDSVPDQGAWGLFTHGGPCAEGGEHIDWTWSQGFGGYVTAAEGHQLFTEWRTEFDLKRSPLIGQWQHGGLFAGYNAMLVDNLELISEVGVNLPQDSGATASAMVGFIASL